ncbi:MAG: nucleotidyltransferase domain-containing protein [Termitinemataceae bacterium]|nr:MAG: nucleotidyltransferase domain-containing protein [Termitinemataceae bacterium]
MNKEKQSIEIEDKHLNLIKNILNSVITSNYKAYIFGSRARNTALKYSDVDLAIDYDEKSLPFTVYAALSSAFEESLLPYTVDIVDLNAISKDFLSAIKNDLVRIF